MNLRVTTASMTHKKQSALCLVLTATALSLSVVGCGAAPDSDEAQDESSDETAEPLVKTPDSADQRDGTSEGKGPCAACAPPFAERPGQLEFSGRLVVRPRQDADPARDRAARERLERLKITTYVPATDEYLVEVPVPKGTKAPGAGENRLAGTLMETGDYEYATPDWIVYPLALPNDPQYSSQWHHTTIQSPQAWDTNKGSSSIIVAVTDTGIDKTHPDLAANRVLGYNAPSDLAEVSGGDVSDIHGHGTHVMGCAGAIGNNAVGVSGVGWTFKLMMVRVTNSPSGSAFLSDITKGARWAVDNGAKVVSASYAGVQDPTVGTTGTYIRSMGGLYLYAADNYNQNHSSFDYPDVIVVGATDSSDNKAWFSSYGTAIDIAAPGTGILSTTQGGGYAAWDGTSMATPLVNGAAGLIWSVNPGFTSAQVENFLLSGANDIGAPGDDNLFGRGRLNVYNGVSLARGAACTHSKCSTGAALGSGCEPATESICAVDPYCCNNFWDGICVSEVRTVAHSLVCAESQGSCAHTLCSTGAKLTAGCDSPPAASSCVSSICAVDPYCCNTLWDNLCVDEVATVCGQNCN